MLKNVKSEIVYRFVFFGLSLCLVVFFIGYAVMIENNQTDDNEFPSELTTSFAAGSIFQIISLLGVVYFLKYLCDHEIKRMKRRKKRNFYRLRKINEQKSIE
ncbi:MAG: hypothetical protein ACI7YS_15815 [Flavobacterium sp.]